MKRPAGPDEGSGEASAQAPEPADDPSRGKGLFRGALGVQIGVQTLLRALVLVVGIAACGLLVAAEVTPLYTIEVNGLACEPAEPELAEQCSPSRAEQGNHALVVLAVFTVILTLVAAVFRNRPAALALAAVGIAAVVLVLVRDAPLLDETGAIGLRFESAATMPAIGFVLSIAGGIAAAAAGALGVAASFIGDRDRGDAPGGRAGSMPRPLSSRRRA